MGTQTLAVASSAAFFLLIASTARADVLRCDFAGTVIQTTPILDGVATGQSFTGSFTFDNDPAVNPDQRPDAVAGYYVWLSFEINNRPLVKRQGPGIVVLNDFTYFGSTIDGVDLVGVYGGIDYFPIFRDSAAELFSSDLLSNVNGRLDASDFSLMQLRSQPDPRLGVTFANISSMSVRVIPELSSTATAIALGTAFLLRSRRR